MFRPRLRSYDLGGDIDWRGVVDSSRRGGLLGPPPELFGSSVFAPVASSGGFSPQSTEDSMKIFQEFFRNARGADKSEEHAANRDKQVREANEAIGRSRQSMDAILNDNSRVRGEMANLAPARMRGPNTKEIGGAALLALLASAMGDDGGFARGMMGGYMQGQESNKVEAEKDYQRRLEGLRGSLEANKEVMSALGMDVGLASEAINRALTSYGSAMDNETRKDNKAMGIASTALQGHLSDTQRRDALNDRRLGRIEESIRKREAEVSSGLYGPDALPRVAEQIRRDYERVGVTVSDDSINALIAEGTAAHNRKLENDNFQKTLGVAKTFVSMGVPLGRQVAAEMLSRPEGLHFARMNADILSKFGELSPLEQWRQMNTWALQQQAPATLQKTLGEVQKIAQDTLTSRARMTQIYNEIATGGGSGGSRKKNLTELELLDKDIARISSQITAIKKTAQFGVLDEAGQIMLETLTKEVTSQYDARNALVAALNSGPPQPAPTDPGQPRPGQPRDIPVMVDGKQHVLRWNYPHDPTSADLERFKARIRESAPKKDDGKPKQQFGPVYGGRRVPTGAATGGGTGRLSPPPAVNNMPR
jgi:hypothetical protein